MMPTKIIPPRIENAVNTISKIITIAMITLLSANSSISSLGEYVSILSESKSINQQHKMRKLAQ